MNVRNIPGFLKVEPVGSRVTVDPPPMDTDEDYLVLVHKLNADLFSRLKELGFEGGRKHRDDDVFYSVRKGDINLIITDRQDFFDRFMLATEMAKSFNLKTKPERITLFQGVLYGNRPDSYPIDLNAPNHYERLKGGKL